MIAKTPVGNWHADQRELMAAVVVLQIMKELNDRLLDPDEKVRSAAVAAVCSTAISYPQVVFLWSCL
jgi:hypothetical protein